MSFLWPTRIDTNGFIYSMPGLIYSKDHMFNPSYDGWYYGKPLIAGVQIMTIVLPIMWEKE